MNNNIRKVLVCGFIATTSILLVYCSHKSVEPKQIETYEYVDKYKAVMYNNEFKSEKDLTMQEKVVAKPTTSPTKKVKAKKKDEPKKYVYDLDKSEISYLEHLVMGEAEGESIEGKIAVAQVALNRVRINNKSLYDVIYEVSGGSYQFSCVQDGRINLEPTDDCKKAVDMVLQGKKAKDITDDVTYFTAGYSSWHENNLTYVTTIGGHKFYKE